MKKERKLTLPCLRGIIGDWVYYSTVIPFAEIDRIDNKHVIKEDRSLDDYLQRDLSGRKNSIRDYLLQEKQRFFNSIIVGVHGANPDWYSLDLKKISKDHDLEIDSKIVESLGILTLSGREILFTIDGQHRIEGIKLGLQKDKGEFVDDELSVIFVAHGTDNKGKVRTRKLFATINREAVKPSKNDLAIIDEVYSYNIVARMLYAEYPKFKKLISLTPNPNIDRNDHKYFINLLTLVEANKRLFKLTRVKQSKYFGPSVEERNDLFALAKSFWGFVIKNIKEYQSYFGKKKTLASFRNYTPGKPLNLLFQPVGIVLLAELFVYITKKSKIEILKTKINKINFELNSGHYKNIYFDPIKNTMITRNKRLAMSLSLYILGENIDADKLKKDYAKVHNINELSREYKKLKLPEIIN